MQDVRQDRWYERMSRLRTLTILGFLSACAMVQATAADRVEFRVIQGDIRVPEAEVCFFPALDHSSVEALFFTVGDTRCLSADGVIEWTPGVWHVYARAGRALVSGHRAYVFDLNGPGNAHDVVELTVSPAATVTRPPHLRSEQAAVWITDAEATLSTIRPFPVGADEVLVPANVKIVPMILRDGTIIAVGDPMELAPGQTRDIAITPPGNDRVNVVTWLEPRRQEIEAAGLIRSQHPRVRLSSSSSNGEMAPVAEPGSPRAARFTLQIFRDVPFSGLIEVRGDLWQRSAVEYKAPPAVTAWVTDSGIELIPAGVLELGLPEIPGGSISCDADDDERAGLVLKRCAAGECSTVSEEHVLGERVMRFPSLPAGDYRIELRRAGRESVIRDARVSAGKVETVEIDLPEFRLFGRITRGGQPVRALVRFETGSALAGDDGFYDARLPRDPKQNLVSIFPCDTQKEYVYVPASDLGSGTELSIDIPERRIEVTVQDSVAAALEGAAVRYVVMKSEKSAFYSSDSVLTGPDGTATLTEVSSSHPLRVCAALQGYRKFCTDPFRVSGEAQAHSVTIRLDREDDRTGVVRFRNTPPSCLAGICGALTFVAGDGTDIGRVNVTADGSFSVLRDVAARAAYVVFAPPAGRLFAARMGNDNEQLVVMQPEALPVDVQVAFSDAEPPRMVGLWLGEFYVPLATLFHHQATRQNEIDTGEGRIHFSDIETAGPLRLVVAPPFLRVSGDPFVRPEYRSLPSFALPAQGRVTVDLDLVPAH